MAQASSKKERRLNVAFALVHQLSRPAAPDVWAATPPAVQTAASAAYFLLSPALTAYDADVPTFARRQLPRLLLGLSRRTSRDYTQYQGQLRGRIAWAATYKARYSQDYDPTVYVCREVRFEYDTPENQLLRYVVQRIRYSLDALPNTLQRGMLYYPQTGAYEPILPHLEQLDQVLDRCLRHIKFRQVPLPAYVDGRHLIAAGAARLEEYGQVAALYQRYADWVLGPSWDKLKAPAREVIFLPHRADGPGADWLRLGAALLQQEA